MAANSFKTVSDVRLLTRLVSGSNTVPQLIKALCFFAAGCEEGMSSSSYLNPRGSAFLGT